MKLPRRQFLHLAAGAAALPGCRASRRHKPIPHGRCASLSGAVWRRRSGAPALSADRDHTSQAIFLLPLLGRRGHFGRALGPLAY